MKTILIGDVHGCYREMMELLNKISPGKEDAIYFTGDLINKGPDSLAVIREVRRNGYRSILGNHEWSYLKRYTAYKQYTPFSPLFVSKKYPLFEELRHQLTEEENLWLSELPFFIDNPEFLLVHGGVFPDRFLPDHHPHEILNVRNIQGHPWHQYYREEKLLVYGHWAIQGLTIKENSIGLDSGCVYGKELSALILPEREIVQVSSKTCVL